jgi:hypothetical protein
MKSNKTGRSVTLEVSLWRRADGHIRLIGKDGGRKKVFMSTVTDKSNSKRRHLHLFRQLEKLMRSSGPIE